METEIWKDVVDYEGRFQVSNEGNVTRKVNEGWKRKVLKNGKSIKDDPQNAYKRISFKMNGKRKQESVHRLVANAFITDHKSERDQVDHKDENRANNYVGNLQWVTQKENNYLGVHRKNLREEIETMKKEEAPGGEVIKKKLADKFENSDIFSFDEQFEIAYKKAAFKNQ